jgi:hypothetical protein
MNYWDTTARNVEHLSSRHFLASGFDLMLCRQNLAKSLERQRY